MRFFPTEVFEVRITRDDVYGRTVIGILSLVYGIHLGYVLRHSWGDPSPLVDFCERLIGATVRAWHDSNIDSVPGREMAEALRPHWERAVHHHMEVIEAYRRCPRGAGQRFDEMETFYNSRERSYFEHLAYGGFGRDRVSPLWIQKVDPKAKEKARKLLMRNLDDGQLKSFKKDGSFRVTARNGKVYTITTARSFNVVAEDGTKYCGQLVDAPVEDQMLAQKLLLQNDPDAFFKNANESPVTIIGRSN